MHSNQSWNLSNVRILATLCYFRGQYKLHLGPIIEFYIYMKTFI